MTDIENAFSFHLNAARKALLRATGERLAQGVASGHAQALSEVRDGTRALVTQHRKAEEAIRLLAVQTVPLSSEQRAALVELSNAMRVSRGEAPLRVAIDS